MTGPEIEDLLRRYRPAGPPPELGARVMTEAGPVGRTWPWVAAAALLLATTLYLHSAADRLAAGVAVTPSVDSRQDAITLLSEMLGGGPSASTLAELAVTVDTTPGHPPNRSMEPGDGERLQ